MWTPICEDEAVCYVAGAEIKDGGESYFRGAVFFGEGDSRNWRSERLKSMRAAELAATERGLGEWFASGTELATLLTDSQWLKDAVYVHCRKWKLSGWVDEEGAAIEWRTRLEGIDRKRRQIDTRIDLAAPHGRQPGVVRAREMAGKDEMPDCEPPPARLDVVYCVGYASGGDYGVAPLGVSLSTPLDTANDPCSFQLNCSMQLPAPGVGNILHAELIAIDIALDMALQHQLFSVDIRTRSKEAVEMIYTHMPTFRRVGVLPREVAPHQPLLEAIEQKRMCGIDVLIETCAPTDAMHLRAVQNAKRAALDFYYVPPVDGPTADVAPAPAFQLPSIRATKINSIPTSEYTPPATAQGHRSVDETSHTPPPNMYAQAPPSQAPPTQQNEDVNWADICEKKQPELVQNRYGEFVYD